MLVAGAGRQRGPPPVSVLDLEIGGGGALRQPPLAAAGRRAAFGCARTLWDFGIGRARGIKSSSERGPRYPLVSRFFARARAAPRPAVSIRRRRRGAMGTVRREPIETAGRGVAGSLLSTRSTRWSPRARDPRRIGPDVRMQITLAPDHGFDGWRSLSEVKRTCPSLGLDHLSREMTFSISSSGEPSRYFSATEGFCSVIGLPASPRNG